MSNFRLQQAQCKFKARVKQQSRQTYCSQVGSRMSQSSIPHISRLSGKGKQNRLDVFAASWSNCNQQSDLQAEIHAQKHFLLLSLSRNKAMHDFEHAGCFNFGKKMWIRCNGLCHRVTQAESTRSYKTLLINCSCSFACFAILAACFFRAALVSNTTCQKRLEMKRSRMVRRISLPVKFSRSYLWRRKGTLRSDMVKMLLWPFPWSHYDADLVRQKLEERTGLLH